MLDHQARASSAARLPLAVPLLRGIQSAATSGQHRLHCGPASLPQPKIIQRQGSGGEHEAGVSPTGSGIKALASASALPSVESGEPLDSNPPLRTSLPEHDAIGGNSDQDVIPSPVVAGRPTHTQPGQDIGQLHRFILRSTPTQFLHQPAHEHVRSDPNQHSDVCHGVRRWTAAKHLTGEPARGKDVRFIQRTAEAIQLGRRAANCRSLHHTAPQPSDASGGGAE